MFRFASWARLGASPAVLAAALASPVLAADTDTVFVTARPVPAEASAIAAPIATISRADVIDAAAGSLGGVLSSKPGIAESSFATGASRPIIRGLDNTRVRIQENGLDAGDASTLSEDHGPAIDPLSARRIEVVRGPATLRYGSEAIGGVVHILNDRIPSRLPERTVTGEASASATSVNEGYEAAALLDGALASNVAVHLDGFWRDAGDYEIPRDPGTQERTGAEAHGFAGGLSLIGSGSHIGASISRFASEYEIPAADEPILIDMEQTRYSLGAAKDLEGAFLKSLTFDAGFSDYTHDEVNEETGEIGSTFNNEEWEGRLEAVHRPLAGFTGAFGFQARTRDLSATGEGGELIAPAETVALAGFLFEEAPLSEGVRLEIGARIEHVEIEGTGFRPVLPDGEEFAATRDFTPVGASLGLVFDLPQEMLLGLTVYGVQRAPDALELFSKGPHEATETFEIGDADLGLETAYSAEANLKRSAGLFGFELSAFYTQYSDFIYKALTGVQCGDEFNTCGVETELEQVLYRQSDATFWGGEAEASVRAAKWDGGSLTLGALFDIVKAELDNGENVPRIPPMRYGVSFKAEHGPAFAAASLRRVDEQTDIAAFETETKGYELLDARVGFTVPLVGEGRSVRIALIGSNLLDADIRNHSSFKKDDVFLPGRSGRLVISASF